MERSLAPVLGATPLPAAPLTAPLTVPSAAVARPDAAQVNAVADVVRQAVTDLPARVTAAAIPDTTAPHTIPSSTDTPAHRRTGVPPVPVTPEQHTAAATSLAETQFTDLARKYGVVAPASHDILAGSFQQDWVNGYHQVLAQATGNTTPATPNVPGTSGVPATPSAPGAPGTPGTAGTPGTPEAAGVRSMVPAGAASRADDTPIHHNATADANASGRDSDSDMSVASDDVFSNLDTSDTMSISDVSSPDESLGGVPGKHGLSDADSSRDEPVSGDPGRHGEPAVAATGQAVAATGQAVGMFESGQRVANWAAAEQARAGSGDLWWCVAATLDVFHTVYKRLGNRVVFDDRIIGPDGRLAPTMGWPQLLEILDTVPERVAHPDGVAGGDVLAALRAAPGSMVVVRAAPPNEPQHVFALHSQPQKSGPPRIQVRDPLLPGAADRPEPDDPIRDPWLRHLFASSTRVAAFDGNGRPATITDLLGQSTGHPQPTTTTGTDTGAFLLASTSPPRGPSHAMLTTSTDPADSSSGGLPSDPAGNGDPPGPGLASGDQEFQNVWDPDLDGMDLDTPKLDEWGPLQDTEQVQSPLSGMPGVDVAWVPLGVGDNATVAVPQQRDAGDHDPSHLDPELLDPAFVEDLWMPYLDLDPDPDLGVGLGPGGVELSALPPGWGWTPPDGTEQVDSLYPPSGVPEVDVAWAPSVVGDDVTAPDDRDTEDHNLSSLDPALLNPAFTQDLSMPDPAPAPAPDPAPDPDLDLDPDLVLDLDLDLVLDLDPDLVLDLDGVDGVGRPVLEFAVPADGYCVLSAFVVADPVWVRDVLAQAGVLPADLYEWLSGPERVRVSVGRMAGVVPAGSELARVNELLQAHVVSYLDTRFGWLPADVVVQRRHLPQGEPWRQVRELSDGQVLARLSDRLGDQGVSAGRVVTEAAFLDAGRIRQRYDEARAELIGLKQNPGPVTDVPQEQLDFVNGRGRGFPVALLAPEPARDYLAHVLSTSDGPLEADEFAEVVDTVANWDRRWAGPGGEFLLPLLAHATGSRITVLQRTGRGVSPVAVFGPRDGRRVDLYYVAADPANPTHHNHYNAAVPAAVPLPSVPAELPRSDEWDRLFTRFSSVMGLPGAEDVRRSLQAQFDLIIDRTNFAEANGLSPEDVHRLRQALDTRGTSVPHLKGALLRLMSEVYEVNITLASAASGFHDNYGFAPGYQRMVALGYPDTRITSGPASPHTRSTPIRTGQSASPHPTPQPPPAASTTKAPLPEPPDHVVTWRPGEDGPATLREYLKTLEEKGELPDRVSLPEKKKLGRGMAAWVKAWAQGLQGKSAPDGHPYTLDEVAELSGNLIDKTSVGRYWREAAPPLPPPPDHVVTWRPSTDGPATLREYLKRLEEKGELPDRVSLTPDRKGKLGPGMAAWVKAWAQGLQGKPAPDGHPYTEDEVAELSGKLITQESVGKYWREAAPLPPPPDHVVTWGPGKDGPATLRAYLKRLEEKGELPDRVSLTPDRKGKLGPGMAAWVKAWAQGLQGKPAPDGHPYTEDEVAELSGKLITQESVRSYWREAAPPPPPDHVVTWRPSKDGPATLRAYLKTLEEKGELPDGVSLPKKKNLGRGMAAWVKAWAQGLQGKPAPDGHPYTQDEVAELSGKLIAQESVGKYWREAAPPLPPPPDHVVTWRPGKDGPATLRAYLKRLEEKGELPDRVSLTPDRQGRLGPGMAAWVKAWAQGCKTAPDGHRYTQGEVATLSGKLITRESVRRYWLEEAPPLPPPPDHVVTWRPGKDGPATLREYLKTLEEKGELPDRVSLTPDRQGRLGPGMAAWVKAWAQGCKTAPDGHPYTEDEVATLSGKLISQESVGRYWREAAPPLPPPPPGTGQGLELPFDLHLLL
ncbi:hypothetical protein JD77_04978 [Micromonospora olivasterospora]|uniref:Uncharacterized protein n=1 Tax=Micromonospora olivasterospora TaxID=1880 RepID=A0A562IG81_MICOL|nr:hypothetical protein JD77_04978 [Micromonospora olivasterospora]